MTESMRIFCSNDDNGDDDEDDDSFSECFNIHSLRLDFQKMENMNNLWKFKNVKKLQLDNNFLRKIEGLDELTQLTWLDLSFNQIEVIEGLGNLKNLEDLSLYNNLVKKLENLDSQNKLQIFSVGKNQIEDYDNLIYLRKFEQLKCLNFEKNPVEKEDYKLKVVVRLPFLNYLDYRLVTEEMVSEARARYGKTIEEVESQEQTENRTKAKKLAKESELEMFRESFIEEFCGDKAIEFIISQISNSISKQLPDVKNISDQLVEKFATYCKDIVKEATESHRKRQQTIGEFEKTQNKLRSDFKLGLQDMMKTFQEAKENMLQSTSNSSIQPSLQLHNDIHELWVNMVMSEIKLGENIEDMIGQIKTDMMSAIGQLKTIVDNNFGLMKKEIEDYNTEFNSLLAKKQMTKPKLTSTINSFENHLGSIKKRIIQRSNRYLLETVHSMQTQELERNRQQMTEINQMIDELRDELDTTYAE